MSNFKDMVRLASDGESFNTKSGKSGVKLLLAVPRPYRKDAPAGSQTADFINAVAYGNTADFILRNIAKGARVLVEGNIRVDQYEKDGKRRNSLPYILINEVTPIDFKGNGHGNNSAQGPTPSTPATSDDGWGNEDIPF